MEVKVLNFEDIFGEGKFVRRICDWYVNRYYKKDKLLSLCAAFRIVVKALLRILFFESGRIIIDSVKTLVEWFVIWPFNWLIIRPAEWISGKINLKKIGVFMGLTALFMFFGISIGCFLVALFTWHLHISPGDEILTVLEIMGLLLTFFIISILRMIFANSSLWKLIRARLEAAHRKVCPFVLEYHFSENLEK